MAFDVRGFLEGQRGLLRQNKLQDVLANCSSRYRGEVSSALMRLGVDVFKYLRKVPEECFANSDINSVKVTENVESIGTSAFAGCSRLTSVEIEDGVSIIGDGAFKDCTSLTSVTLPDTIDRIPASCFSGCTSLAELYIPESVKIIGLNAFEGCNSIKLLTPYREKRVDKLKVKANDEDFFRNHLQFIKPEAPVAKGLVLDEDVDDEEGDSVIIDVDKEELVEAFSESMPTWLKQRLIRGRGGKAVAKLPSDSPVKAPTKGRDYEEDLFSEMMKKGIDPNSVEIIHDGEIPTSVRDPRLKDPYIPIFLLKGKSQNYANTANRRINPGDEITQVYVKGINDHELCLLDSSGKDRILAYMPGKDLLPMIADFAYIDTRTLDTTSMKDKKSARAKMKAELIELKDYFRETNPDVIARSGRYSWEPQYDKSGYLKDPHKYDEKLAEMRKNNYSKTINNLRDRLVEAKQDVVAIMSELDLDKMANSTLDISGIRDILGYMQTAQSYYEQMCQYVERALSATEQYYRDSFFETALGRGGYGDKAGNYLYKLEKMLAPYKNVILDW